MIKWNNTKEEHDLQVAIANRYIEFHHSLGIPKQNQIPKLDLLMDIEAAHCNGNPLRLQELLDADDLDFAHDIIGIVRNIDRTTGELMNCFVPRYSTQ
tara:strand:- start:201 stop:494 length:294 start_codon:yes stop_codon:yes gene_type:complete